MEMEMEMVGRVTTDGYMGTGPRLDIALYPIHYRDPSWQSHQLALKLNCNESSR